MRKSIHKIEFTLATVLIILLVSSFLILASRDKDVTSITETQKVMTSEIQAIKTEVVENKEKMHEAARAIKRIEVKVKAEDEKN